MSEFQFLCNHASIIFLDFDGVIKDSVDVKTQAFRKLFSQFGADVEMQVVKHHEQNGGISRYNKIPLYLKLANEEISEKLIKFYCDKFSDLVKHAVVKSDWVPGILKFLQNNKNNKKFVLVTATPIEEIMDILKELGIVQFFDAIYGAPTPKEVAIADYLRIGSVLPENALMLGDSSSDYDASLVNGITFILRRTQLNQSLQIKYNCPMVDVFENG